MWGEGGGVFFSTIESGDGSGACRRIRRMGLLFFSRGDWGGLEVRFFFFLFFVLFLFPFL